MSDARLQRRPNCPLLCRWIGRWCVGWLAAGASLVWVAAGTAAAQISAVDDSGHRIALNAPAKRIVSLAPHTTELLFAAGAGERVVGVSAYSDYPAQASRLPSVGDAMRADLERVIALKPDLIVAWKSGNNAGQLARLRALGFAVFDSEPRKLDDIASSLERLGTLAGSDMGRTAAEQFRRELGALRSRYAARTPVTVFYQIWPSPLMTLNDAHIVSEAIRVCGGVNVFGSLAPLVPTVSRESVLNADPQVIFISDEDPQAFDRWRSFGKLTAVRHNTLYRVNGSVLNRAGPRMAGATASLCTQIDDARHLLQTQQRKP